MDLLDALSGNTTAQSPVALCEHPSFRRGYSALYKAIVQLCEPCAAGAAIATRKLLQQSFIFETSQTLRLAAVNYRGDLLRRSFGLLPRLHITYSEIHKQTKCETFPDEYQCVRGA